MNGEEVFLRLVAGLLGRSDLLEHTQHSRGRILDLNIQQLDLGIDRIAVSGVEKGQLLIEVVQIHAVSVICLDRVPKGDDSIAIAVQEDGIQVRTAHTDIRGRKAKRRHDPIGIQALGRDFTPISVKQFVCLAVQAPDSGGHHVVEMRRDEMIAGKLLVHIVTHMLEQREHLHDGVVFGIAAKDSRHLAVRNSDEAVSGGDAHAVVDDLCENFLGYPAQRIARNPRPFQHGLQSTGANRKTVAVHVHEQTGIRHRIAEDLIAVGQIPGNGIARRRIVFQRLKSQVFGSRSHPAAVLGPFAEKSQEVSRIAEGFAEVVCVHFGFHHV